MDQDATGPSGNVQQSTSPPSAAELLDFKASAAIEGMPKTQLAYKMASYESLYQQWKYNLPDWKRKLIFWIAETPFRIFRQEIQELALAHSKGLMDDRAAVAQKDFYQQYVNLVGDYGQLRAFLFANFYNDLKQADALNTPLLTLVREIMMKRLPPSNPPAGTADGAAAAVPIGAEPTHLTIPQNPLRVKMFEALKEIERTHNPRPCAVCGCEPCNCGGAN